MDDMEKRKFLALLGLEHRALPPPPYRNMFQSPTYEYDKI
jgi:hypothetical protein